MFFYSLNLNLIEQTPFAFNKVFWDSIVSGVQNEQSSSIQQSSKWIKQSLELLKICLKLFQVIHMHIQNFEQMFKSFNDCLFVLKIVGCLKIVYFVPTKLLNFKIFCWKQMEFVQSNTSLFNRKRLLKSIVEDCLFVKDCWRLFIRYRTLLNIDYRLLNIWPIVERLHTLLKPNS